jgi:hypothetical protein
MFRLVMHRSIIAYILATLMMSTAVVYFVAAAEESAESGETDEAEKAAMDRSNLDDDEVSERAAAAEDGEGGLATQAETAFFTVTGLGYVSVGAWMLKDKGRTKAPYIIAIAGSISIIGLYVASRTTDLPIVGLQDDVGAIDILSKVLQVSIVAASVYVINSNRVLRPITGRQGSR